VLSTTAGEDKPIVRVEERMEAIVGAGGDYFATAHSQK